MRVSPGVRGDLVSLIIRVLEVTRIATAIDTAICPYKYQKRSKDLGRDHLTVISVDEERAIFRYLS
jgi:hypothetical protein